MKSKHNTSHITEPSPPSASPSPYTLGGMDGFLPRRYRVIAVCGGRDFTDRKLVNRVLGKFYRKVPDDEDVILVHGGAPGVDTFADEFAKWADWLTLRIPAKWARFRRSAGPLRNQQVIDIINIETLFAFPGNKGTNDMIGKAKIAGIKIRKISTPLPD